MRRTGGLLALLLLAWVTAACGDKAPPAPADPATAPSEPAGSSQAAEPAWRRLAGAPLSARHNAAAVAVNGELLVLGGEATEPCPPNASCALPPGPVFRDGAAYDPQEGTWRELSEAPVDLMVTGHAVIGGTLYLKVPAGFVAYDVAGDSWRQLPSPPRYESGERLLAMGDRLVLLARSHEQFAYRDWVLDPREDAWTALPGDPMGPSYDRDGFWTGERLIVTGKRLEPQPGAEGPSLARVAAYDPDDGTWRRLDDTGQIGGGEMPWAWVAGRGVSLEPGGADGGKVGNYGRVYPYGGMLDGQGRWSPLPDLPERSTALPWFATSGEDVVAAVGLALHVPSSRAVALPAHPELPQEGVAAAWLGEHLYFWGGVRWSGDQLDVSGRPTRQLSSEMLGDGWAWGPFPG